MKKYVDILDLAPSYLYEPWEMIVTLKGTSHHHLENFREPLSYSLWD